MPGATLSLEHVATGTRLESEAIVAGAYIFPSLRCGDYRLTVRFSGMETWQAEATLRAGQQGQIDPVMAELGQTGLFESPSMMVSPA